METAAAQNQPPSVPLHDADALFCDDRSADSGGGDASLTDVARRASLAHGMSLDESGCLPGFQSDPFGMSDLSCESLRRHLPRSLVAFVWYGLCVYVNMVSQLWLEKTFNGYYESKLEPISPETGPLILWDITHRYMPSVDERIAHIWTYIPTGVALVRFGVLPGSISPRFEACQRILAIWGVMWLLRAVTLIPTNFPATDLICEPPVLVRSVWLEGLLNPTTVHCHDYFFSGHTFSMTVVSLAIMKFNLTAPWCQISNYVASMWQVGGHIYLFVGYYFIIASRLHYTVDVVFSAVLSFCIFHGYFLLVESVVVADSSQCSRWKRAVRWFELHAKDLHFKPLQGPSSLHASGSFRPAAGIRNHCASSAFRDVPSGGADGVATGGGESDGTELVDMSRPASNHPPTFPPPLPLPHTPGRFGGLTRTIRGMRLGSQHMRCLVTGFVFMCGVFAITSSEAWLSAPQLTGYFASKWRAKTPETQTLALWDTGHNNLPKFDSASPACRLLLNIPYVLYVVCFLVVPASTSMRWTLTKRTCLIMGAVSLSEGIAMRMTLLPDPDGTGRAFGFSIGFRHALCLTLCFLAWVTYRRRHPWPHRPKVSDIACGSLVVFFALLGCGTLIASRRTYSVTVFRTVLMTTLAWCSYHGLVEASCQTDHRLFSKPICRFLSWFEAEAEDVQCDGLP